MNGLAYKKALKNVSVGLTGGAAALAIVWTYRNRRLFTVNDVTTGESFDYPELRAHVYYCSLDQAIDAARRAADGVPGIRIVQIDSDRGLLMAEAESAIGGFIDDMDVRGHPLGPRHTRVVIRSRSRVGRGDLGENARHIRMLQAEMDALLVGG